LQVNINGVCREIPWFMSSENEMKMGGISEGVNRGMAIGSTNPRTPVKINMHAASLRP
jgi:hypothetical protein